VVFLIIILFVISFNIKAEMNFNGYIQNWFSVTTNNNDPDQGDIWGFSNRRIRFIPTGNLGEKFEWGIYFSFDKFSPEILEAYLKYSITKFINLRVGKWSAPGAVSGSITHSDTLDFIERAPITRLWGARNALSGYRAVGVEMSGKFMNDRIFYALMISNAVTDKNNWMSTLNSLTSSNEHNGLAFWGRLEASPLNGLRIGGFYGSGTEEDSAGNNIKRGSSGAHVFFVKEGFNFKVEYISGDITGIKYSGMYVLFGYKFNNIEPIIRYDNYKPIEGKEKFTDYTVGINFTPDDNVKLQANYIYREESISSIPNNIFYLNFQFSFNSKK